MRISAPNVVAPAAEIRRHLLAAVAVAIGYYLLARYSLSLPVKQSGISYIWPADGLSLGVLLATRRRFWRYYLVAVFVGNFLASNKPLDLNLLYSVFNVTEPLLVATVITRLRGVQPRIDTLPDCAKIITLILSTMVVAIFVSNSIDWLLHRGEFWRVWLVWYVSDSLGMLLIAPLVLATATQWREEWRLLATPARKLEATILLACLLAVSYFSLGPGYVALRATFTFAATPLTIPMIFMLWAAVRFGIPGGLLGVATVMSHAFFYTALGVGPFADQHDNLNAALLHVQVSFGIATVLALFISARTVEWRHALSESQVSRKRLEFAIEASDMLVFESTTGSGDIAWSGDVRFVLDVDPEELSDASHWRRRIHPEDRTRIVRLHSELALGRRPSLTLDYRLLRDDGSYATVAVDAYAVPVKERRRRDERVRMDVIGVLRNVTERRRIEEERRRLSDRLRQAEKLEAVGALAGGIAHDFNNILGAILGYAEMLQGATDEGTKARKYSDTIASAGGRGKALVAQILAFSRSTEEEKHAVDLRHIVDEVVATLAGSLPSSIRVRQTMADDSAVTFGNATHLYQLIMNLCTNAMQAMPGGGELHIDLSGIEEVTRERILAGGPIAPGRYHRLAIADEGTGIDPAVAGRIFEPFFSTKEMGKGTGLGLAISHGVTLSHGGGIDLSSRMGEGTTFVVYLPVYSGAAPVVEREPEEVPRGHGEAILVVDDEPALVELSQDLLAELGYEPVGYTSSVKALAAYNAAPHRFAAVLTDEVMPDLTGTELCGMLRAQSPTLPILVASGYGGSGFELRATNAGATRILKKPYRKHEIGTVLASVLVRKELPVELVGELRRNPRD
jgi:signal transduction histidine kinase/integral membrane sensor domain MASE1/CheY-like chemotaxis protein